MNAALREYMYRKYPNLPSAAVGESIKWFSSPIAAARFSKFLKFDGSSFPLTSRYYFPFLIFFSEKIYFKFASMLPESDHTEVYRQLEPEERVNVLASTYPSSL